MLQLHQARPAPDMPEHRPEHRRKLVRAQSEIELPQSPAGLAEQSGRRGQPVQGRAVQAGLQIAADRPSRSTIGFPSRVGRITGRDEAVSPRDGGNRGGLEAEALDRRRLRRDLEDQPPIIGEAHLGGAFDLGGQDFDLARQTIVPRQKVHHHAGGHDTRGHRENGGGLAEVNGVFSHDARRSRPVAGGDDAPARVLWEISIALETQPGSPRLAMISHRAPRTRLGRPEPVL